MPRVLRPALLLVLALGCAEEAAPDGSAADAGRADVARVRDAAPTDADPLDTGPWDSEGGPPDARAEADAAPLDAAPTDALPAADATPEDGGTRDAQAPDVQPGDASRLDAAPLDAQAPDAQPGDASQLDAAPLDAQPGDAGPADAAPPDAGPSPSPLTSFFVTSQGNAPNGADFGGITGADQRCQGLAVAAGLPPHTWRAYLRLVPAYPPGQLIDPYQRIGPGPWFNFDGALVAQDPAGLEISGVLSPLALTEHGGLVPQQDHDVLTGYQVGSTSSTDTCDNWTSNDDASSTGFVGHVDWSLPTTIGNPSWNSSHRTGCSQAALASTAGSGRLYCFAEN